MSESNSGGFRGFITQNKYRLLTTAVFVILAVGTVFYHLVEKLRWLDAMYMSVITLTTVGYGDFTPKTDLGKIFTMAYVFIGIGIVATFATSLVQRAGEKRMQKQDSTEVRS